MNYEKKKNRNDKRNQRKHGKKINEMVNSWTKLFKAMLW